MSKETLDLMLGLNRQELEIQIALQCAPLLTGRKISNLLTVDKRFRSAVLRLFRSSAVSAMSFMSLMTVLLFFYMYVKNWKLI